MKIEFGIVVAWLLMICHNVWLSKHWDVNLNRSQRFGLGLVNVVVGAAPILVAGPTFGSIVAALAATIVLFLISLSDVDRTEGVAMTLTLVTSVYYFMVIPMTITFGG